jgi:hypothetical protein
MASIHLACMKAFFFSAFYPLNFLPPRPQDIMALATQRPGNLQTKHLIKIESVGFRH